VRPSAWALLLGGSQPVRADVDLEQAEQIEDIENLSLAELLEQPVTSASRYAQKPGGSPVLVSTIDAELIQALGYRTVGEALRGMRARLHHQRSQLQLSRDPRLQLAG
jgi:hypothetical protein